jgi:FG-GAP-like repeat
VSYPVGQDPVSVTIQDINGDGIPDMLVADRGSNDVSVLFGEFDAAGNWTARPGPRLKSGGQGPVAVTVRDMNGDGIPDLVVTNGRSGTLGVLPGVGQGFFNDHAIQILNIPGNPLIGAPSFAGSSDAGVVVTGDGRIIGFNLGDFDASVRTVFLPPPGQAVTAVWALRDGGLVAAEQDGAVVLLELGSGSSLFQLGQPLAPLTGIPSDPSALAVLEGQFGLQVFVTSAGQDRVYLFEPLSGLLLPAPSIGPSLPPLTPGPPTLVSAALGEELAVGVILSGGLLFVPDSIPTAGAAITGQPLSGLTAPSAFDDDSAGNQLPRLLSVPSENRPLDSQIEELLQQGKPNMSPDGAVPDSPPANVTPPDDSAAPFPFSQPVSQEQVPPVSGLSRRGGGTGVAAPSAARADSGEPDTAESGRLARSIAGPGAGTKTCAAGPEGNAAGRDWDRAWISILAVVGLTPAPERRQSRERARNHPRRRAVP